MKDLIQQLRAKHEVILNRLDALERAMEDGDASSNRCSDGLAQDLDNTEIGLTSVDERAFWASLLRTTHSGAGACSGPPMAASIAPYLRTPARDPRKRTG